MYIKRCIVPMFTKYVPLFYSVSPHPAGHFLFCTQSHFNACKLQHRSKLRTQVQAILY